MQRKKVLVIGLGRFGGALADELWDADAELIVVDKDPDAVDAYKSHAAAAFVGDASDPGVLERLGAGEVDAAVVTSGEDFEGTVLCVSQLVQMGAKAVYARAANARQAHVLKAVGATRVVQVEEEMGRRLAVQVLNPVASELVDFAMHFRVVPWTVDARYVGKTLAQAKLRSYGLNVLGIVPAGAAPVTPGGKPRLQMPTAEYVLGAGDTLLLVCESEPFERFLASFG